jgi:hypothetical protein
VSAKLGWDCSEDGEGMAPLRMELRENVRCGRTKEMTALQDFDMSFHCGWVLLKKKELRRIDVMSMNDGEYQNKERR